MMTTMQTKKKVNIPSLLLTIFTFILSIAFIFPVIWSLFVSFNVEGQPVEGIFDWFKPPFTLENYKRIFTSSKIPRWSLNSAFITVLSVVLVLFTSSLAAFALAKIRFPGRKGLYLFFLLGLMVPGEATIVPLFLINNSLGLIDTYAGLLLPGLASSFNLIIMTSFFKAIPDDLFEAAKIDGANNFTIYSRIALPNSKPVMVTVALFVFMASWNNYLWPLLVAMDEDMFTLPVGLPTFVGTYSVDFTMPMTANMVAAVPAIIVYLLAERQIVEGISLSGVKG